MKKVNYEMLQQDLKFPLKKDEGGSHFLWDSNGLMVAQFDDKNILNTIPKDLVLDPEDKTNDYVLDQGDFMFGLETVGCVRGWGHFQYKKDGEQRQDNIANYLLNLLNSL